MRLITQDPVKWSASMVSSWTRLFLFGFIFLAFLIYVAVHAAENGWRSALFVIFFLSFFQLSILYALRRLVLRVRGEDIAAVDPRIERKHFLWMIVMYLAGAGLMLLVIRLGRGV